MILLFGAELTQQWAKRRGSGIETEEGAVRVIEHEEQLRPARHGSAREAGRRAARASAGASTRSSAATPRRGGLADYILGLPVLYLLFRRTKR
jgi:hypothetical protein